MRSRRHRRGGLTIAVTGLTLVFSLGSPVSANEDSSGPQLQELSITPSSIDTSVDSVTVKVIARITDDVSGVQVGSLGFYLPGSGAFPRSGSFSRVSGTALNGVYEADVVFQRWSAQGDWQLDNVYLRDAAGNPTQYGAGDVAAAGFPSEVAVTSPGDSSGPQLQELSITPATLNTAPSSVTVKVIARITDDVSGVQVGSLGFYLPESGAFPRSGSFSRVSGTALNGVYEADVVFQRWSAQGDWQLDNVYLRDAAGNPTQYGAGDVAAAGFPSEVTVKNVVMPPGRPRRVLALGGNSQAIVSWAAPATDGGSPVTAFTVTAQPGGQSVKVGGTSTQATVANLSNGTSYTFTVVASNAVGDSLDSAPSNSVTPNETTAPTVLMRAPARAHSLSSSLTATWLSSDASGVASHDVRWRRARFDGVFGGWVYPAAWQNRATSTASLTGAVPGYTYCFSARSTDTTGDRSAWTTPKCSAVALDERAATIGRGWTKKTDSRYYASTFVVTKSRGASITTPSMTGRYFALIATRCSGCGTVAVSRGSNVIKTIKLDAATIKRKTVIPIASYTTVKTGKLTIRVTSTGKPVQIDGIGISK